MYASLQIWCHRQSQQVGGDKMETKKRNRKKNENIKYYLSRLPIDLYKELDELGAKKGQAVNKLIIFACRAYLENENR